LSEYLCLNETSALKILPLLPPPAQLCKKGTAGKMLAVPKEMVVRRTEKENCAAPSLGFLQPRVKKEGKKRKEVVME